MKKKQNISVTLKPHKIQLPGFLIDKDIGLGELIKRTTNFIGLKHCGNCEQRAKKLNSWLIFSSQTKINNK